MSGVSAIIAAKGAIDADDVVSSHPNVAARRGQSVRLPRHGRAFGMTDKAPVYGLCGWTCGRQHR